MQFNPLWRKPDGNNHHVFADFLDADFYSAAGDDDLPVFTGAEKTGR